MSRIFWDTNLFICLLEDKGDRTEPSLRRAEAGAWLLRSRADPMQIPT